MKSPKWPEKWPFYEDDFNRMDESSDGDFYSQPRLVYHIGQFFLLAAAAAAAAFNQSVAVSEVKRHSRYSRHIFFCVCFLFVCFFFFTCRCFQPAPLARRELLHTCTRLPHLFLVFQSVFYPRCRGTRPAHIFFSIFVFHLLLRKPTRHFSFFSLSCLSFEAQSRFPVAKTLMRFRLPLPS